MRLLTLFALLLAVTSPGFAASSDADAEARDLLRFEEALKLLSHNKVDDAYSYLELIPPGAPLYRFSLLEIQKIHYRRGEWDKFFGYAAFYRKQILKSFNEPELLMLEGLALTKHCQFEAAEKILRLARATTLDPETLVRMQSVEDLYDLQSRIPGNVKTKSVATPFKAFTPVSQWKIADDRRELVLGKVVKNPRAVRVYVKNVCARPAL